MSQNGNAGDKRSSLDGIQITRRTENSLIYRFLRIAVLWPLRPALVTPHKEYPGGSLRLEKHPHMLNGVTITERKVEVPAATIAPPAPTTPSPPDLHDSTTSTNGPAEPTPQTKTELDVLWIYDFVPSQPPAQVPGAAAAATTPGNGTTASARGRGRGTHTIYYFAGGGFRMPPASEHWKFCAHLAASLAINAGATTTTGTGTGSEEKTVLLALVSYPLAPHTPACDALPLLRRWLITQALATGGDSNSDDGHDDDNDHTVSLAGDSSGANVALSLALWCADRLADLSLTQERAHSSGSNTNNTTTAEVVGTAATTVGPGTGVPGVSAEAELAALRRLRGVLAVSPPTDLRPNRCSDARAHADGRDKVLGQGAADAAAVAWSRGSFTDGADVYLSPNLAELDALKASGMRVDGVIGTSDVLAYDSLEFLERLRAAGVPGRWLVWEGQMHCFPLAAGYGLKEGKEARQWVAEVLQEWKKPRRNV